MIQVVTALYGVCGYAGSALCAYQFIRCNRLIAPATVDYNDCYQIIVNATKTDYGPLNDPNNAWTADQQWGMQCGTDTDLYAMVAVTLASDSVVSYFWRGINCCRILY
jgi:hypothetical protein